MMNHVTLVGGWLKTIKVNINSFKGCFMINISCKFTRYTDYFYLKKGHGVFYFYSNGMLRWQEFK